MTSVSSPSPARQRGRDARRLRSDQALHVADVLRHQIHRGEFTSHCLPSEEGLAAEFGVSRNTVRDALGLLKNEGLIARTPRKGTRVVQKKVKHDLDTLLGLKETLQHEGEVRNEVRAALAVSPPPVVQQRLGLDRNTHVVYIERLRFLGGLPLSLDATYLVPEIGDLLISQDLVTNDLFALIEEHADHQLGEAEVIIEATTADAHTAALLHTAPHAPVLLLERLTRVAGGRPVDLEYIRFRADRITMQGKAIRKIP